MIDERDRPLREADLDPDPLVVLHRWLDEARAAGVEMPDVMTLATASADGRPSARMVLLKDADATGLTFYTNYESRKGHELADNPRAALLLYWHVLGRQVRVEGAVERLAGATSDAYFRSRPLGSRAVCRGLAAERSRREPRRSWNAPLWSSDGLPARTFRDPRAGAATASSRTNGSSGSTASTACTTDFAIGEAAGAGPSSDWRRRP